MLRRCRSATPQKTTPSRAHGLHLPHPWTSTAISAFATPSPMGSRWEISPRRITKPAARTVGASRSALPVMNPAARERTGDCQQPAGAGSPEAEPSRAASDQAAGLPMPGSIPGRSKASSSESAQGMSSPRRRSPLNLIAEESPRRARSGPARDGICLRGAEPHATACS
jgi:hypothetical protein